jgi:hypothetical protein
MDVTKRQEGDPTSTPRPDPLIFYEWAIEGDGSSGIAPSTVRAKVGLTEALQELGRGRGFVRPVTLAHDGDDWTYARFSIDCEATYTGGVITWWEAPPRASFATAR